MAHMEWSENLSVGINEIDEQHKKLVSQINALHDGMRSGQGKDTLEKTLGELADYTRSCIG
jgi:hemerythrin